MSLIPPGITLYSTHAQWCHRSRLVIMTLNSSLLPSSHVTPHSSHHTSPLNLHITLPTFHPSPLRTPLTYHPSSFMPHSTPHHSSLTPPVTRHNTPHNTPHLSPHPSINIPGASQNWPPSKQMLPPQ